MPGRSWRRFRRSAASTPKTAIARSRSWSSGCARIKDFPALGAVGVIAINPGKVAHWGGGSPIWGTADLDDLPFKPAIPAAAVSKPDGEALIALAQKGGRAKLVTEFEEGWFRNRSEEH